MKAIIKFLQESRTELAKVSWPTRGTVINLTLAVLSVSLVLAAYTAGVDFLMTQGVKWITVQSEADAPTRTIDLGEIDSSQLEQQLQQQLNTQTQQSQ